MLNVRVPGVGQVKIQETPLDKAISWISPIHGARRMRARAAMAIAGAYIGARKDRRATKQWTVTSGDADSDIISDLPDLRERSRDLARNAPLAGGAISMVTTNVIGQGLKLQCRIDRQALKMDDKQAEAWEEETEREWTMWCGSKDCDVARTLSFGDVQELAFRQVLENGDVFVLLPRYLRGEYPYMTHLQLVEADRVCNKDYAPDSDILAGGVQKDAFGAPVAYHILRQHPGNTLYSATKDKYTWNVVQAFGSETGARNVIHLYRALRPCQTRGVPYLAPVIESLKQLDRYTEAELMAAVVSGMFTVFIETESGNPAFDLAGMGAETGATASDTDMKLGSGAIVGLARGEKIATANPGRPNQAFDPFVQAILRQIGTALELPYEVLIRHFNSSYSASRAALLEAWRFFRGRRSWMARNFCQLVYENWLTDTIALGRIKAPGYLRDYRTRHAYLGADWVGDAPGQIDPLKEVDAAGKRLRLGITTLDRETVELTGGDFETNHPRIAKERKILAEIGLWTPRQEAPGQAIPPAQPEPDDDKEDDNQ